MKYNTRKISIILPCLNEEDGVGPCASSLLRVLEAHRLEGELIFVDNGSTDGTLANLKKLKKGDKRIIIAGEDKRGYGHALRKGFGMARGELIYMADCDGTYDFDDIPRFIGKIEEGHDFIVGNRFSGGMDKDAMTFSRRHVGNPVLSSITRALFNVKIKDIHCGARMIRKGAYDSLFLKTGGMEFATEMIVRASKARLRVDEISIRYHGRIGKSKLNEITDGTRHLLFMLLESMARKK